MADVKADLEQVDSIITDYRERRWALIPLLQEIQRVVGYIPPEAVPLVARSLGLFPSQVQGVVTFYAQLYTAPRGKNIVRVCRGTACHVRGAKTILKLVKQQIGVEEDDTTPDFEYTLETVACIGCCALAPNMVVNSRICGQMNPGKVASILSDDREQRDA